MRGREPNYYGQVCTTYERPAAGSLDGHMVYYKLGDSNNIQFAFALRFKTRRGAVAPCSSTQGNRALTRISSPKEAVKVNENGINARKTFRQMVR